MDFHGNYLHGGLGHFPWNSMEKVAMEFHKNYSIDYIMDLQGVSWKSQELEISITNELHGQEYITDFGSLQWISSIFIINQRAKKVISDSPGLVDLQLGLSESCS